MYLWKLVTFKLRGLPKYTFIIAHSEAEAIEKAGFKHKKRVNTQRICQMDNIVNIGEYIAKLDELPSKPQANPRIGFVQGGICLICEDKNNCPMLMENEESDELWGVHPPEFNEYKEVNWCPMHSRQEG